MSCFDEVPPTIGFLKADLNFLSVLTDSFTYSFIPFQDTLRRPLENRLKFVKISVMQASCYSPIGLTCFLLTLEFNIDTL